jgi:hypothetical protein
MFMKDTNYYGPRNAVFSRLLVLTSSAARSLYTCYYLLLALCFNLNRLGVAAALR